VVLFNHVPPDLAIDADREHMNRVLTNLLRNAIQAIEAPRIEDSQSEGHVTIRSWREGTVVMIEVADTGPGIPEKVRGKLFEAFQSAARPGGVGLGLAIASELVRAHGGEIRLAATGPDGTCFRLAVPDRVTELKAGRRGERPRTGAA
jgi:signal transduction histidine kinase